MHAAAAGTLLQRVDEFFVRQAPMPVSGSGVMLGAISFPNGVSIARPPAKS